MNKAWFYLNAKSKYIYFGSKDKIFFRKHQTNECKFYKKTQTVLTSGKQFYLKS